MWVLLQSHLSQHLPDTHRVPGIILGVGKTKVNREMAVEGWESPASLPQLFRSSGSDHQGPSETPLRTHKP